MLESPPCTLAAKTVAIVGGGPAGLMAAEVLARAGARVTVYDRMPSVARKFLLAGRGGLNLTHGEPLERFITRYDATAPLLASALADFPPRAVVAWCEALGQPVFTGSSGRVFPCAMKASPLLRAWLARLAAMGVVFAARHLWRGFAPDGGLRLETPGGDCLARPDATILALGGASWPQLGSDASWVDILSASGVAVSALQPANCGFDIAWSAHVRDNFAGTPLKNIAVEVAGQRRAGEAVITRHGLEGSVVYAHARALRDALARGPAEIVIDLKPGLDAPTIAARLARQPAKASASNRLRKAAGLDAAAIALLREAGPLDPSPAGLAQRIKQLPLKVAAARPLERAISTAGGVAFAELDANFMLRRLPGIFVAGEMLDWEAPTGGYLLQACFATGRAAGLGASHWLAAGGVGNSGIGAAGCHAAGTEQGSA